MEAFDDEDVSASEEEVDLEDVSQLSEDDDSDEHEGAGGAGTAGGLQGPLVARDGLTGAAAEVDAIMAGELTGDAAILNLEVSGSVNILPYSSEGSRSSGMQLPQRLYDSCPVCKAP